MNDEEIHESLVVGLQEAQKQNLVLREKNLELKKELKIAKSQSNSSSSYRSELESLREEQRASVRSTETLRSEIQRLVAENTRLQYLKEENTQIKSERSKMLDQIHTLEQRVNDSILEKERIVTSSSTRFQDLERSRNEAVEKSQRIQTQMDLLRSKTVNEVETKDRLLPNVHVKTVYQDDVRNWHPPQKTPYKALLEFLDQQYESTYIITYQDLEKDKIRLTCDDDLYRAFDQARQYGWSSLKINIDIRVEQELRRELGSMELKILKLKKTIKKLKNNQNQTKKGQALLDAIYLNRKKEQDMTLY